jgi:hypothetical protein
MKIELELPDWVEAAMNIHILAGVEEIIRRRSGKWELKVVRCDGCGKCCDITPKPIKTQESDVCQYLIHDGERYRCGLGANMPYNCCVSDGEGEEYCCVRWKKLNIG